MNSFRNEFVRGATGTGRRAQYRAATSANGALGVPLRAAVLLDDVRASSF
jgi:hypothetical protein